MRKLLICMTLTLVIGPVAVLFAQSPGPSDEALTSPPLSNLQQQIQRDYERFEKSLYDVAEQSRGKDPERAELLYRARSKSQEERILSDMELIAELLAPQIDGSPARYGPAADQQIELLTRMETVLKLLQSLDERSRIDAEIKRLEELLKDTTRLIARQKDVRADTQRSDNTNQLKQDQERVADEAKKLSNKIEQQDKERQKENSSQRGSKEKSDQEKDQQQGEPKDGENKESKPGDSQDDQPMTGKEEGQPSDSDMKESKGKEGQEGKPSEGAGKPQDGEPEESEGQKSPMPSEQSPSQPGKPQGGKPQDGKPQQGQSGEQSQNQQSPQDEKTPGRDELEQAREQMQQAIEKLEEENKGKAVEDQSEAVAKLEQLKAELEEILRQLREEEKETYLTLLEARFQIMLKRQERINKDTTRLSSIPEESRLQQNYNSQTDGVRKEQADNVIDAEKTLNLLKEEGSSVAFPEAIEQMLQNMLVAEKRLATYDTGKTTQLVEQLILETLEEMIAALQKELEKMEKKKQEQGQPQESQQQEPGLVDQIAELKMIRSLQNQINRLTTQLSTEIEEAKTTSVDQLNLIEDLADRQQRIKDATYDLSIGRNN